MSKTRNPPFSSMSEASFQDLAKQSSQERATLDHLHEILVDGQDPWQCAKKHGIHYNALTTAAKAFIRGRKSAFAPMDLYKFETAVSSIRDADKAQALRLHMIDGYSLIRAAEKTNVDHRALIYSRRRLLKKSVPTKPTRTDFDGLPQIKEADLAVLKTSPFGYRITKQGFQRAHAVLVERLGKDQLKTIGNVHHVYDSAMVVLERLSAYHRHTLFPKSKRYLKAIEQALAQLDENFNPRAVKAVRTWLLEGGDHKKLCKDESIRLSQFWWVLSALTKAIDSHMKRG